MRHLFLTIGRQGFQAQKSNSRPIPLRVELKNILLIGVLSLTCLIRKLCETAGWKRGYRTRECAAVSKGTRCTLISLTI